MDEQTKGFRSAVFGGFRREDVLRYIEETDAKYYEESERLRSSLDDAQTAMGELRGQNEKLTEKNAELIAEIEGGIKKEVSVGCSAAKRSCSICGKDAGLCEHERGNITAESCATPSCGSRPTPMSGRSWRCPPSGRQAS